MVEKIRGLCRKQGISISALEREIGLSNNSIGKWDVSLPSVDKVVKVADYFGIDIRFLLGEEDKKTQPHKELSRGEAVIGMIDLFNSLDYDDKLLAVKIFGSMLEDNNKDV